LPSRFLDDGAKPRVHQPLTIIPKHTPQHKPLPQNSKCFLLRYPAGLRVIVHSANLIQSDMENKTQSAYYQDFPRKDAASPPSSDFEDALRAYFACNEV
jgi:tyrosyl-DNA phosphodiesterase-1